MNSSVLTIKNVKKRFGNIQALDGVSFDVPKQSIFGLLGPNGAGKTTLFSIIANFLGADAGNVSVLGIDVHQISKLQGRLTILPQDALFQRNVPIIEQLTFFRLLDGKGRKEAEAEVRKTLELVGLGEYLNRRVHALSHGMIKRLGLAQAFLGDPEVILLDEPTSGLDPQNARNIRDLIRQLQERATVVLSSHNLAEIQELCDHVAILDDGELITAGTVADITRSSYSLDLELSRDLSDEEARRLESVGGVERLDHKGATRYTAVLDLENSDIDVDAVTSEILSSLLDLNIVPRSFKQGSTLEDVFLKMTG